MFDFLKTISVAAANPYAIVAYSIAAVLFLLAGQSLAKLRLVLQKIHTVSPKDRKSVIEIATQTKLPDNITAEQWIKLTRMRMVFYLVGSLFICVTTITVVSITNNKTEKPHFILHELNQ